MFRRAATDPHQRDVVVANAVKLVGRSISHHSPIRPAAENDQVFQNVLASLKPGP